MKNFKNMISKLIKGKTARNIYRQIFKALGTLPKRKNLVVFESFHGKQYSDNPRAIYEYMKQNTQDSELIWSVDRRATSLFENENLPYIKRFTLKWFMLMPRAKYWVNNVRLPNWMPKPKKTVYVQTWHGTPLKRLGLDIEEVHMPGTNTEKYKQNFIKESKQWDYLVSPNAYSSKIFRQAFGYNGEIIERGYPRNDYLVNHDEKDVASIKDQLGIPHDKKVILYAPTWRDDDYISVGNYEFKLKLDLEKLQEALGNDYIILLRMHYLIANDMDLSSYQGFAFDGSDHADIRELYVISDLLITDYSSVFFDYAILRRPIIFFTYDLEAYKDRLRGFYFDLELEAPGPMTRTTNEVVQEIQRFEYNQFQLDHSFEKFYENFCYLEDGQSSEQTVNDFYK